MTTEAYRKLSIGLGISNALVLALLVWTFGDSAVLRLRLAMAEGDTGIHAEMVKEARLTKDPKRAAECLRYLIWYYPSGSKQVTGSKLDRIVERCRTSSALAIIAHMRAITGKDLGDKPEPWIEQFASQ